MGPVSGDIAPPAFDLAAPKIRCDQILLEKQTVGGNWCAHVTPPLVFPEQGRSRPCNDDPARAGAVACRSADARKNCRFAAHAQPRPSGPSRSDARPMLSPHEHGHRAETN